MSSANLGLTGPASISASSKPAAMKSAESSLTTKSLKSAGRPGCPHGHSGVLSGAFEPAGRAGRLAKLCTEGSMSTNDGLQRKRGPPEVQAAASVTYGVQARSGPRSETASSGASTTTTLLPPRRPAAPAKEPANDATGSSFSCKTRILTTFSFSGLTCAGTGKGGGLEELVGAIRGATPAPGEECGPKIDLPLGPARRMAFNGGPDGPAGGNSPGPVPSPAASFCPTVASQMVPRSCGHLTVG